jgi:hypothetical protein
MRRGRSRWRDSPTAGLEGDTNEHLGRLWELLVVLQELCVAFTKGAHLFASVISIDSSSLQHTCQRTCSSNDVTLGCIFSRLTRITSLRVSRSSISGSLLTYSERAWRETIWARESDRTASRNRRRLAERDWGEARTVARREM